jgi:hypothetical protein
LRLEAAARIHPLKKKKKGRNGEHCRGIDAGVILSAEETCRRDEARHKPAMFFVLGSLDTIESLPRSARG